jgi:hypothetical protein
MDTNSYHEDAIRVEHAALSRSRAEHEAAERLGNHREKKIEPTRGWYHEDAIEEREVSDHIRAQAA